jgi:hypothetical protein
MSYSNPTKTVADVANTVKRLFGDESGVQLVDNDIIGWTNEAQQAIADSTKVLKAKATKPLVNGTNTYSLTAISPKIDQIESLLVDGRRVGNMSTAQAEETISTSDPLAEEDGFPAFWYEWAGEITFWPKPNLDGEILIRYTAMPDLLTTLGNTLALPDEFFSDVVNFVLRRAYEMDENESMMNYKRQEFESSMLGLTDEERQAQNMTYETITVYDNRWY